MEFKSRTGQPTKARTQCLVAGVYDKKVLSDIAKTLDKASRGYISRIIKKGDMTGKVGSGLLLHEVPGIAADRLLLVGLGGKAAMDVGQYQNLIKSTISKLKITSARNALLCLSEPEIKGKDARWKARQTAEIFAHTMYSFTHMKGKQSAKKPTLNRVEMHAANRTEQNAVNKALLEASAIAKGVTAARNLGNTPSNICTPAYMARESRKLARDNKTITTTVLEEKDMKRLGMGALLSVGKGSAEPSKLIIMNYKGAPRSEQPYVIVGKGISFDSGGISLKAGAGMGDMIYDMCGAASILGTMSAVAELNLPINVIGVIPAAENMPSGSASKPGDIVKTMSGQTVEILNTDAEGRLVLCDALTYIGKFKPRTVIDVATLTGAIKTALGKYPTGLFANDDDLANDLQHAADASADRIWRLPIWEDYQTQLKSQFADMANVGGREAGSITAACFLARFTKKYRWAHLDIAATGFTSSPKGATGRPVPLLTQYLIDRC
ncbi:MAG: leucyl aminopeptidase [Gammaproteobacteria bacterium]|nr:leucyl aminopeptidase [Gammaproteobacteria bacterium]